MRYKCNTKGKKHIKQIVWFCLSVCMLYFVEKRNERGNDRLFVSQTHPCHAFLEALYEGGGNKDNVKHLVSLPNS